MPLAQIACVCMLLSGAPADRVQVQPASLHDAPAGAVLAMRQHAHSGVLSLTLSSGVVVHFREMGGEARVRATLSGPAVEALTPAMRRAVGDALAHPAPGRVVPEALGKAVERDEIRLRARAGSGVITIRIDAPDAAPALDLLGVLLADAQADPERLEQFKDESAQRHDKYATSSEWALQRVARRVLAGEEREGDRSDLDALTLDGLQGALERTVRGAAVEVGLCAPLSRAQVVDLCERTLAALEPRPEVSPLQPDAGAIVPIEVDEQVEGIEHPAVFVAYALNTSLTSPQARALRVAGDLLEARLERTLASGRVAARFEGYAGPGRNAIFYAAVIDGPPDAPTVLDEALSRLADEAGDGDEVARLGAERSERLRKSLEDSGFWAAILADRDRLRIDLDELLVGPHVYRTMTPQRVQDAVRRAATDGARIRIRVYPPE